jgi:RND family efflux transporter MFP subunit
MKIRTITVKLMLPLLIVAGGIAGMQIMALSKVPPVKEVPVSPGTLVETMTVKQVPWPVSVHATGTVQSRREAKIAPQVSGRVTHLADTLFTGGFFKKGELLFTIEASDYALLADKSRASLAKAEYNLAQVESQARVARMEWDRILLDEKEKPNPLVLYTPQLKEAKANFTSARADLSQRLLDIRRTRVYAPFNCRIREKQIDLGQYVAGGTTSLVVTGTDVADIVVPVPLGELKWLSVPRNGNGESASAVISISMGGGDITWQGKVHRSLGEVDPKGRMIRLVVGVADPYGLSGKEQSASIDLAEGLFVDVTMAGSPLKTVIPIPVDTLREGNTVWVMNANNQLEIRKVTVIRKEREKVLVGSGLAGEERIILTHISGAANGMKLRERQEG